MANAQVSQLVGEGDLKVGGQVFFGVWFGWLVFVWFIWGFFGGCFVLGVLFVFLIFYSFFFLNHWKLLKCLVMH